MSEEIADIFAELSTRTDEVELALEERAARARRTAARRESEGKELLKMPGRCLDCGARALPGRRKCEAHRVADALRASVRRKERIAGGLCVLCPNDGCLPAVVGFYCLQHDHAMREYLARRDRSNEKGRVPCRRWMTRRVVELAAMVLRLTERDRRCPRLEDVARAVKRAGGASITREVRDAKRFGLLRGHARAHRNLRAHSCQCSSGGVFFPVSRASARIKGRNRDILVADDGVCATCRGIVLVTSEGARQRPLDLVLPVPGRSKKERRRDEVAAGRCTMLCGRPIRTVTRHQRRRPVLCDPCAQALRERAAARANGKERP